jgi:hypothetical protein
MQRKLVTHILKTEQDVSTSARQTAPISDLSLTTEERGIDSNYSRNIRRSFHENPSIVPDF